MEAKEQGTNEQGKQEEQKVEGDALTFDGWFESQPEGVRKLLDEHTGGLKSALKSERESRKDLEKQLRDLAKSKDTPSLHWM